MGSGASKGKRYQDTHQYGELYLQTDKTTYQPGDTVTGTIHLDLTSQYPGHQLFLKLKGREVAHILKETPTAYAVSFDTHSETKDIIKQNTLVYSWETSAPLGQFSIPFSFLLPNHLPASFYQYGYHFLAFIEYQLEAFLQPPPNTDFPKMKYKQPITIRNVLLTHNQHLEVTTALESCSCCNQGSNILKATLDKSFYSHGENIGVTIELDNSNSKMANRDFALSFDQKLEIKAKNETLFVETPRSLLTYPGIVQTKKVGSHSYILPLPPFQSEFDYKLEFDKYNPKYSDLFKIWTDGYVFTSPTKSSLISSTFSFKISCLMDGHHPTVPKIEFPISILAPDSQPPVLATAPSNWQPLVLDRINVAFSSEHQNQHMEGNMMEIQSMPGNVASLNQVIFETPQTHQ